jgi:hypothetical protein
MMKNAREYRQVADRVTAEARAKVVKDAHNYIDAVVAPLVGSKASKGLYEVSIVVPTTIDMDLVAELLEEKYFFCIGWDEEVEDNRRLDLMW